MLADGGIFGEPLYLFPLVRLAQCGLRYCPRPKAAWAKATLSDPAPPRCKRFILQCLAIGKSSCQMALLPLESCPEDA